MDSLFPACVVAAVSCAYASDAQAAFDITTTKCPGGVQGKAYAGCVIAATGGAPPYQFSIDSTDAYPPLPEGLSLDSATGLVSGAEIGGQGAYFPRIIATDSTGAQASREIKFAITWRKRVSIENLPFEFNLPSPGGRRDDGASGGHFASGADLFRLSFGDGEAFFRQHFE
jgi:hypothetical protein